MRFGLAFSVRFRDLLDNHAYEKYFSAEETCSKIGKSKICGSASNRAMVNIYDSFINAQVCIQEQSASGITRLRSSTVEYKLCMEFRVQKFKTLYKGILEEGSLPDRDQDLKPRFHSSRFHGSDDAEDDDDDIVNVWNLRKCSAAALDIISNVFGDEILPALMSFVQKSCKVMSVQSKLSLLDDASWKEREAAVLALGAIAEGCINGLYPHLTEIVAFLIPLLDDKFPLIRSISCWTVSRFSKFIVQGAGHREGHEQFEKVLTGLLRRILDDNKRVQEAACSAFTTLEEEAADLLAPRLEIILQHLMCAYGKYQRKNLRIVYDAIGTLADAVGGDLNQPKCLEILMPPLIAKWQQLSNSDKDLFPLLECFTSIAQALGSGFSQFSQPVFQRCLDIIQTQQLAKVDPVSVGVQFDKEFIVCSLDLLSGLTEGLGSGIESLVSQSNLRDLLLQCCMDDGADIRQSAFALLGDLARVCPIHLRPRLPEFLDVAAKQLNTPKLKETISVANNACWAIGELAIKESGFSHDISTTVYRSKADCPEPEKMVTVSVDGSVLDRMGKIMSYLRLGSSGKILKKKKKDKDGDRVRTALSAGFAGLVVFTATTPPASPKS
ncbi:hypothetical protein SSX86_011434 [Deinandra increscens subsp. villosa]|uniref:RED-like N-terminal domain-containing protein n=1 Tax=Deinandra increscens subsp. villosa TaxID=3103831 RepID=A0AAP0DAV6_9ASTR